jgi:hypothetical protein
MKKMRLKHLFPQAVNILDIPQWEARSQSYQTFFFIKQRFFCFLLLSLSVCSMSKYCPYFEMAKLKSKNWKNQRNQSLVGLTPGPFEIFRMKYYLEKWH